MERVKNFWIAFKDIALVFSFAVNFVLVVVLLVGHAVFRTRKRRTAGE